MAPLSAIADRRNLSYRILSGAILGPVTLWLAYVGGIPFQVALAAVAAVSLGEWLKMTTDKRWPWALPAPFIVLLIYHEAGIAAAIATLAVLAVMLAVLIGRRSGGLPAPGSFGVIAFGLPYVGLPLLALAWLRDGAASDWKLVFFVLVVIWGTDVGAYFVGRLLGGPRLAPSVSPNKTWSGAIGGGVVAALVALIWGQVFSVVAGSVQLVAVAVMLSFVGQCGDLFESAVKRRYGVKDSGDLIPGHGGMLDRIDALLAAAPVFAILHAFGLNLGLSP